MSIGGASGEMRAVKVAVVSSLAPEELTQIARVWHAAILSMPLDPPLPEVGALLRRLESEFSDCQLAFVREGTQIVAFVVYDPGSGWLRQLFVHPRFQRAGLGTRLLAHARQGMPQGWLRTDLTNQAAQRFYASQGLRVRRTGPHPVSGAPTVEFEWP